MLNSGLPQLRSAQAGCFGSSPARAPDVLRLPASPQPVAALATRRRRRASLPPPAPFLSQAMSRAQHGSNEASGCYGVGARLPARHLRRGLARRAAAAAQQADGHRRGHGPRLRQCSFFFYTRFFLHCRFFFAKQKTIPIPFKQNRQFPTQNFEASSPLCFLTFLPEASPDDPHPTLRAPTFLHDYLRLSFPERTGNCDHFGKSRFGLSFDCVHPSTVFILFLMCLGSRRLM